MKLLEKGTRSTHMSRQSPSPLGSRQQGYITLSPHRSKLKSQASSKISEDGGENRLPKAQSYCFRQTNLPNVEITPLTNLNQRPFKPIPKFSTQQILVRLPRTRTPSDLSRKSQKHKILVTTPSQLRPEGDQKSSPKPEKWGKSGEP